NAVVQVEGSELAIEFRAQPAENAFDMPRRIRGLLLREVVAIAGRVASNVVLEVLVGHAFIRPRLAGAARRGENIARHHLRELYRKIRHPLAEILAQLWRVRKDVYGLEVQVH